MILMKFFVQNLEESFTDVGSDILAIWWVVPGYISLPCLLLAGVTLKNGYFFKTCK